MVKKKKKSPSRQLQFNKHHFLFAWISGAMQLVTLNSGFFNIISSEKAAKKSVLQKEG